MKSPNNIDLDMTPEFRVLVADVYERLVQKGKKAGFFQLLATQTVSAIWHVSFHLLTYISLFLAFI